MISAWIFLSAVSSWLTVLVLLVARTLNCKIVDQFIGEFRFFCTNRAIDRVGDRDGREVERRGPSGAARRVCGGDIGPSARRRRRATVESKPSGPYSTRRPGFVVVGRRKRIRCVPSTPGPTSAAADRSPRGSTVDPSSTFDGGDNAD